MAVRTLPRDPPGEGGPRTKIKNHFKHIQVCGFHFQTVGGASDHKRGDVTKPYNFTGFGAIDVTKPYKFIGFGARQGGGTPDIPDLCDHVARYCCAEGGGGEPERALALSRAGAQLVPVPGRAAALADLLGSIPNPINS